MDLGLLDDFPRIGFQNKVRFSGCDQVSMDLDQFLRVFISPGSETESDFQSKDKVKITSADRWFFRVGLDLNIRLKDRIKKLTKQVRVLSVRVGFRGRSSKGMKKNEVD